MPAYVKLESRFPEIIASMRRRISSDLKEGAENIRDDAKGRINSKTGTLAASGQVKGAAAEFRVEFGAGQAFYAKWIEFGRENAPPYPFLIPAAEAQAPEIISKIEDTLHTL